MWFQQIATGPITSTTTPSGTSIGIVSNATPALSEATSTTVTSGGVTVTTTGPLSTVESISTAAPVILRPSSFIPTRGGTGFGGGSGPLYIFTTATFTPGGASGPNGPSLSQARVGLTGSGTDAWKNNTDFFNTTNGIQLWTVPVTGNYRIEARGAAGRAGTRAAGRGTLIGGNFALVRGEVVRILVGHQGQPSGNSGTGGGGTFVVRAPYTSNESILVIAGGGGGGPGDCCGGQAPGGNASTGTSGTQAVQPGGVTMGTPGDSGQGGGSPNGSSSGAGGGFFSNGSSSSETGGTAFVSGGFGGGQGGFGGGGGSPSSQAGGGGGGYSGGSNSNGGSQWGGGGGGGSWNSGTSQSGSVFGSDTDGQVVITII